MLKQAEANTRDVFDDNEYDEWMDDEGERMWSAGASKCIIRFSVEEKCFNVR